MSSESGARQPLVEYLYALGDDELLLGHRDSEWTGLGPILEEDIAFSSMAQDEMGHALVWYGLLHELGEPDPDTIAYRRAAGEWRNALLFELPSGDYARSLMRRYLADMAEAVRYDALAGSSNAAVAAAAARIRQEEKYHIIHGRTYIARLSGATSDSRKRMQAALDSLYPYALAMWEAPAGEEELVRNGTVPVSSADLLDRWTAATGAFLTECGLAVPTAAPQAGGRAGKHGAGLDEILEAMQRLHREDPEAVW